jgi:hypothetical protein
MSLEIVRRKHEPNWDPKFNSKFFPQIENQTKCFIHQEVILEVLRCFDK